jgi:hypothetical protein
MRIRNLFDAGSGMEKFGSRINIPDPQQCPVVLTEEKFFVAWRCNVWQQIWFGCIYEHFTAS